MHCPARVGQHASAILLRMTVASESRGTAMLPYSSGLQIELLLRRREARGLEGQRSAAFVRRTALNRGEVRNARRSSETSRRVNAMSWVLRGSV